MIICVDDNDVGGGLASDDDDDDDSYGFSLQIFPLFSNVEFNKYGQSKPILNDKKKFSLLWMAHAHNRESDFVTKTAQYRLGTRNGSQPFARLVSIGIHWSFMYLMTKGDIIWPLFSYYVEVCLGGNFVLFACSL